MSGKSNDYPSMQLLAGLKDKIIKLYIITAVT